MSLTTLGNFNEYLVLTADGDQRSINGGILPGSWESLRAQRLGFKGMEEWNYVL
jgi:hypothetical protein